MTPQYGSGVTYASVAPRRPESIDNHVRKLVELVSNHQDRVYVVVLPAFQGIVARMYDEWTRETISVHRRAMRMPPVRSSLVGAIELEDIGEVGTRWNWTLRHT